ncbi:MAG: polysaccharide deacetylase family protein, partial [Bacteroidota bacterium]
MKYFVKTPNWLKWCFPNLVWEIPAKENIIYLTFDDGPIPEITPWVLDQLNQYQAKATFFVVGDNVRKHPAIFKRLSADGHRVGNHTFHHVNGKHTDYDQYMKDVSDCAALVETNLFRPPYGRTTPQQRKALLADYQIIMW